MSYEMRLYIAWNISKLKDSILMLGAIGSIVLMLISMINQNLNLTYVAFGGSIVCWFLWKGTVMKKLLTQIEEAKKENVKPIR